MGKTGISQQMLEQVTKTAAETAAETAVRTALEYLEKEKQKQEKQKRDWRLRNTKLLLKNYRMFVAHSKEVKETVTRLEDAEALDELYTEDFAVESIRKSKQRTLTIVRFLERMLDEYRKMCEESEQSEDLRRYQVIHDMYISEKKMNAETIAACHEIDTRTIYRDINEASKTLSVLIFGIDGIRLEL